MLSTARAAGPRLGDAAGRVVAFLRARWTPQGGFRGRSDAPDLYYTVFGAEGLAVLGGGLPADLAGYLRSFGGGDGLDFVHLVCLARLWADVPGAGPPPPVRTSIRGRLGRFRAADGGFSPVEGAARGTAYGAILGLMAYEDIGIDLPDAEGLARSVESLRAPGGGYSNEPGRPAGLTPATAAAVTVLGRLGRPAEDDAVRWLLQRGHERGGFAAAPKIPLPDLLSTATALYALARAGADLGPIRKGCLEFLDAVWCEEDGGFRAHALDDAADCEYTWYGLLALGSLGG